MQRETTETEAEGAQGERLLLVPVSAAEMEGRNAPSLGEKLPTPVSESRVDATATARPAGPCNHCKQSNIQSHSLFHQHNITGFLHIITAHLIIPFKCLY